MSELRDALKACGVDIPGYEARLLEDNFKKADANRDGKLSLEECLEFAREDECVEVTPEAIRIRKLELDANARARAASQRKRASEN